MRKFVVPALAAACLSGVATAPAAAADLVTVEVVRSDLDLTSEEDQATLETRIDAAIKTACMRPVTIRNLKAMQAWDACKASAMDQVRQQLDESIPLASL